MALFLGNYNYLPRASIASCSNRVASVKPGERLALLRPEGARRNTYRYEVVLSYTVLSYTLSINGTGVPFELQFRKRVAHWWIAVLLTWITVTSQGWELRSCLKKITSPPAPIHKRTKVIFSGFWNWHLSLRYGILKRNKQSYLVVYSALVVDTNPFCIVDNSSLQWGTSICYVTLLATPRGHLHCYSNIITLPFRRFTGVSTSPSGGEDDKRMLLMGKTTQRTVRAAPSSMPEKN